jgi:hypothetical protein
MIIIHSMHSISTASPGGLRLDKFVRSITETGSSKDTENSYTNENFIKYVAFFYFYWLFFVGVSTG